MMYEGSMRARAMRVAIRRISWIDQRINGGCGALFLGRCGIGVMADGGHHGESEHDQRDMAMPTVPGAGLVVVETKFVLGGLEAVFDRPAMPFHRHQRFDGCADRTSMTSESWKPACATNGHRACLAVAAPSAR